MLIAITRKVSPAIEECELTHLERQPIHFETAVAQHARYELALRSLGVEVISLPAEPDLPDSVFVEDTALVLDEVALLTRPGAISRRPEVESISRTLSPHRELERIEAPGCLDGGDILQAGRMIYVGISTRSNPSAIQQMQSKLKKYGYHVKGIKVTGCLHLKSAVTCVAENMLLINPTWIDKAEFEGYEILEVHPAEMYGANAVQVGEVLLYQPGFPETAQRLEAAGLQLNLVDASELGKAEGALTCCSLIFKA
jgi:dimethylargininase